MGRVIDRAFKINAIRTPCLKSGLMHPNFIFMGIAYFFWAIVGVLFAGQWIMFLCLLAFGFSTGFYRRRFCKNSTTKKFNSYKT